MRGSLAGWLIGRLEVDPAHGRMLDREADDAAHFVLIHAAFDGRHEDHVQPDLREPVQRA